MSGRNAAWFPFSTVAQYANDRSLHPTAKEIRSVVRLLRWITTPRSSCEFAQYNVIDWFVIKIPLRSQRLRQGITDVPCFFLAPGRYVPGVVELRSIFNAHIESIYPGPFTHLARSYRSLVALSRIRSQLRHRVLSQASRVSQLLLNPGLASLVRVIPQHRLDTPERIGFRTLLPFPGLSTAGAGWYRKCPHPGDGR